MNLIKAFAATLAGSMIFAGAASATCDGIPRDPEGNSCFIYSDRNSCQSHEGCEWTPEPPMIRICNDAAEKISITAQQVRANHNVIFEEGWWNLDPKECVNLEAPAATRFSYFAKSYQGNRFWAGNLDPMCFDPSGQAFKRIRKLNELSCGEYAGIPAYTSIDVKEDDFHRMVVAGPGRELTPVPPRPVPVPGLKAIAVAWNDRGEVSMRHADTLDQAKQMALEACTVHSQSCQLAVWLDTDRRACLALTKDGTWLAYGWSHDGIDDATRIANQQCANAGRNCELLTAICNDNW